MENYSLGLRSLLLVIYRVFKSYMQKKSVIFITDGLLGANRTKNMLKMIFKFYMSLIVLSPVVHKFIY